MRWILDQEVGVPVICVRGIHEFYRNRFPAFIAALRREARGTNVVVLEKVSRNAAQHAKENKYLTPSRQARQKSNYRFHAKPQSTQRKKLSHAKPQSSQRKPIFFSLASGQCKPFQFLDLTTSEIEISVLKQSFASLRLRARHAVGCYPVRSVSNSVAACLIDTAWNKG